MKDTVALQISMDDGFGMKVTGEKRITAQNFAVTAAKMYSSSACHAKIQPHPQQQLTADYY